VALFDWLTGTAIRTRLVFHSQPPVSDDKSNGKYKAGGGNHHVNHRFLPPNGLALHSRHTFNWALLSGSFMVVTARRLLHHSHFRWLAKVSS
jgi:hypothetical protein